MKYGDFGTFKRHDLALVKSPYFIQDLDNANPGYVKDKYFSYTWDTFWSYTIDIKALLPKKT